MAKEKKSHGIDPGMQVIIRGLALLSNVVKFGTPMMDVFRNSYFAALDENFKKLTKSMTAPQRKQSTLRKDTAKLKQDVDDVYAAYDISTERLVNLFSNQMQSQNDDTKQAASELFAEIGLFVETWQFESDETRPSIYTGKMGRDVNVIIREFDLNFNLAQALKYLLRCSKKPLNLINKDLAKAVQYLQFQLESETRLQVTTSIHLNEFTDDKQVCAEFEVPAELHTVVEAILSIPFNREEDHQRMVKEAAINTLDYMDSIDAIIAKSKPKTDGEA